MISNTSEYIPYESVAPILFVDEQLPELPFFSGTGFFARFLPYDDVFFITAGHCIFEANGEAKGVLHIPLENNGKKVRGASVVAFLQEKKIECDEEFEDVVVCILEVDDAEQKKELWNRSLILPHQDDADLAIKISNRLRTVGYPSVSKDIDDEKEQVTVTPRGFHFKVEDDKKFKQQFKIYDGNWAGGGLGGFSGSPILEFSMKADGIVPVPVGILLTTSYFISINVATNLIAGYIRDHVK